MKSSNRRKKEQKLLSRIHTVDQAVDYLMVHLRPEDLEQLRAEPDDKALAVAYHCFGMYVRAVFGLWLKRNPELLRSCGDENMFADEASSIILEALLHHLRHQGNVIRPNGESALSRQIVVHASAKEAG